MKGAWWCSKCPRHTHTLAGLARLRAGRCLGREKALEQAQLKSAARSLPRLGEGAFAPVPGLAHDLRSVADFVFCRRCGAYSRCRAVRLLGQYCYLQPALLVRGRTRLRRRDR